MKFIYILICLLVMLSCGNGASQNDKESSTSDKINTLKIPTKSSEEVVLLTIIESDLAGTYELKNNDIMSQMNVGYDASNNITTVTVSRIQPISKIEPNITLIKWVEGIPKKGEHSGTDECLMFQIVDLDEEKPYAKIDAQTIGCGSLTITSVGDWKDKGHIKRERGIVGYYKDDVVLNITNDDDSNTQQNATFEVQFALIQQEIKTNN